MRPTRLRFLALLAALATLLTFAAVPVSAITLQRTWGATLGSNGTLVVRAFTNGVGSATYNLHGLRVNATYTVQIRKGTCGNLGKVTVKLPAIRTSTSGTVRRASSLYPWTMTGFWTAARSPSFVVRLVSGTSVRCARFSFAHATRVAVSGIGIDLPVIRGSSAYPPCRVALYQASVAQPREPGITFLYAHARTGMFLPLLTSWKRNRGASLIGRTVKVWTSDSYVSSYRIVRVRTSQKLTGIHSLSQERLWLQTSTGPNRTFTKLIVEAVRFQTVKTTYAASHPRARPIRC